MKAWNYGDGLGEHGIKRYLITMCENLKFALIDFTASILIICLDVS